MSGVTLRELEWTDLATLAALEQELFADDAWSEQTWWAELAGRPRRDYVVATADGSVVGYAGIDVSGEVVSAVAVVAAASVVSTVVSAESALVVSVVASVVAYWVKAGVSTVTAASSIGSKLIPLRRGTAMPTVPS